MRILLTGASGYIGSAVARAALAAGHDVDGLVRHGSGGEPPDGVRAVPGDITDPAALARAARGADAVIHTAADPADGDGSIERAAVATLLGELAGSGRALVYTSGTWVLGSTGDIPATERAPLNPPPIVAARPGIEAMVRSAAANGVRSVVIRPANVYGGGRGYLDRLLTPQDGVVRHFEDGANRWSVVHVDDLAALYVLAVERAGAGAVFHGATGSVRARDAAAAAAGAAGAVSAAWPRAEAEEEWGAAVEAYLLDQVVSSERARRELGWAPQAPGLIEELRGLVATPA